jgi:ATP-dependent DNA helicase RecQ
LPGVPVLALTASATPDVQVDICEKLNPPSIAGRKATDWRIFRQSFERANLSYSVFRVEARINKIIEILNNVPGTGIVYCKSRKRTKEISELLQLQRISADYYHAGLSQEERSRKQEEWINNKIRVIVCTNAFGMGIDKPDVRTVVHADVPDCLENYYQEAGRAGRDGKKSYAVLLYDDSSLEDLEELITQRFPSQKEIREVYQAVANYLQLATGIGQGEYYDFDFLSFLKKFKLKSHTALYSLKALEQEGWLAFNEQVFLPPTVQFTVTKEYLYSFQSSNSSLDPIIKTLLRAYEGIFDHFAFISEIVIAQLLRKDAEEVKKQLNELANAGIIEYRPRKDSPQLLLLRNRVRAEDISIDMVAYNSRKETLSRRVREIIGYVNEEDRCRSQIIAAYFGDEAVKACGICDNCLRRKTVVLDKEEFEKIHARILDIAGAVPVSINELLLKLKDIKKEKAWKVVEVLQAENKIAIGRNGLLRVKI